MRFHACCGLADSTWSLLSTCRWPRLAPPPLTPPPPLPLAGPPLAGSKTFQYQMSWRRLRLRYQCKCHCSPQLQFESYWNYLRVIGIILERLETNLFQMFLIILSCCLLFLPRHLRPPSVDNSTRLPYPQPAPQGTRLDCKSHVGSWFW